MSTDGFRSQDYAREYIRLSLLGVFNINDLTECTKSLPARTRDFRSPDQAGLDRFLNSNRPDPRIADDLRQGRKVPGPAGKRR